MALIYHESEAKCPCGCGQYADEAHSRDWDWDVQHMKCYAGAAIDQVRREFDKAHKGDPTANDGRLWFATPVEPVKPRN